MPRQARRDAPPPNAAHDHVVQSTRCIVDNELDRRGICWLSGRARRFTEPFFYSLRAGFVSGLSSSKRTSTSLCRKRLSG